MPKKYIYFVDVTNRDGVQTSRLGLAKLQKTIINLMLDDIGITQSEFGFPTTKHEINYLTANLELVDRGVITKTKLSGWMRGIEQDVLLSFQNVPRLKHVNLSVSTSDQMIKGKFGGKKTREDIIESTNKAIDAAVACGALSIGVNAEDASRSDIEYLVFAITMDRDKLYKRINARVNKMFKDGLKNEVKALIDGGAKPNSPAMQGIGYKELISHFNKEMKIKETKELIKRRSRNYAKRQLTFMRGMNKIIEVPAGKKAADEIISLVKAKLEE